MISVLKKLWNGPEVDKSSWNDAIIIDVRTPMEFENGHLEESINIPLSEIRNHIMDLKQSDRTIVLICRSGARSGRAAKMLRSQGIDAYNGGAWSTFSRK